MKLLPIIFTLYLVAATTAEETCSIDNLELGENDSHMEEFLDAAVEKLSVSKHGIQEVGRDDIEFEFDKRERFAKKMYRKFSRKRSFKRKTADNSKTMRRLLMILGNTIIVLLISSLWIDEMFTNPNILSSFENELKKPDSFVGNVLLKPADNERILRVRILNSADLFRQSKRNGRKAAG